MPRERQLQTKSMPWAEDIKDQILLEDEKIGDSYAGTPVYYVEYNTTAKPWSANPSWTIPANTFVIYR